MHTQCALHRAAHEEDSKISTGSEHSTTMYADRAQPKYYHVTPMLQWCFGPNSKWCLWPTRPCMVQNQVIKRTIFASKFLQDQFRSFRESLCRIPLLAEICLVVTREKESLLRGYLLALDLPLAMQLPPSLSLFSKQLKAELFRQTFLWWTVFILLKFLMVVFSFVVTSVLTSNSFSPFLLLPALSLVLPLKGGIEIC